MKAVKIVVSVGLLLMAVSIPLSPILRPVFTARTDSVTQGRVIKAPCDFKIISIEYSNKKPMVVMRPMREGEQPEVWILKPLDEIEREPAGGDLTTVVQECTETIRK